MYFVDVFFDVFLGRSFGGFGFHFGLLLVSFWEFFRIFLVFFLELQKMRLPRRFFDVLGGLLATADPRRSRFFLRNN